KAVFDNLSVYSNGNVITYSVQELDVADYTSVISNATAYEFTVTNSHVPVVTEVNVTKVWNDADNQDGVRPANITVVLLKDGVVVASADLNAGNDWKAVFADLPVYSNGKAIVYSIEEVSVANYTTVISNSSAYVFTVTNTHVPVITVINITKVWRETEEKEKEISTPIEVTIYADGVPVANATLFPGNDWKLTFDDLPVYKDGKVINYTVSVTENNKTTNITSTDGNFTILTVPTPNMTVEKTSLNKTVKVDQQVYFVIVVTNTGDCELTGVYVIEEEYSEGLVFDHMVPNSDWTFDGNNKFTYNKALGIGESASFTVVFNALSVGFKINTVTAGNNLTNDTVNSTDTTNVTNETVPPEPDVPVEEPPVPHKHHVPKHVKPGSHATGNPIVLLLLTLFIPLIIRRKQN
ncbi:MAG: Cna B-type domain-containing protein, partial [Methanobrevibacter thaueri]|nr:Cna B-type domain-containing protein [Methanobrevibacter thaueri]